MTNLPADTRILSIDIGGSKVKAAILNAEGVLETPYEKVATPVVATPAALVDTIKKLAGSHDVYQYISVGFPGYVRDGIVHTAPNLGTPAWKGFPLQKTLEECLQKPVQVINDADLQGLGVVSGKGLEMVITLGTGFGTALLLDGKLLPHLEMAHHPLTKSQTYDQYVGATALESCGLEKWNIRMQQVLGILQTVFNYDRLYISGGNAKKLNFLLAKNIIIVSNKDGIKGGARLWHNIS